MKHKTKAQMMWEVSKEAEENFLKVLAYGFSKDKIEELRDNLFKMIRGAEYRRGKEDGQKEMIPFFEDCINNTNSVRKKLKQKLAEFSSITHQEKKE